MGSNDLANLRYTGARLFASLLDNGDAIGAIIFSNESHPLTQGISLIQSESDKKSIVSDLQTTPAVGETNVTAAFQDARTMLQNFDLQGRKPAIVFLTDGQPTVPKDEALDVAKGLGFPFYSIALAQGVDRTFLNQLTEETNGVIFPATDATDLLDAYLQILGNLKDRTVIGSGINTAPGDVVLSLDPGLVAYVNKVSFIIAKPSTASYGLIDPFGQEVNLNDPRVTYSVTDDPLFSVVTVDQPSGGNWTVRLGGIGSVQVRAIIYSRLRAQITSPQGYVEAGQPMNIIARLQEEQSDGSLIKIIGNASFSALITRPDGAQDSLDRFYDDGTNGDITADDGDFTRIYNNANLPGIYQIQLTGKKGDVPIIYQGQVQAIEFPKIVVDQPSQSKVNVLDKPINLQFHLGGTEIKNLDSGGFIAKITAPSTKISEEHLTENEGTFSGTFMPTENGLYTISFEPNQAFYSGLPYTHSADLSVEVKLIPSISLNNSTLQIAEPYLSQKKIEIAIARKGILVTVSLTSTSDQNATVSAHLENMPGYTLVETGDYQVQPGQNIPINLHIKADPNTPAGTSTAAWFLHQIIR